MSPRIITSLFFGVALATSVGAAEEKVDLNNLPAAAAKTLKAQAGDARITNVSKEKEDGKTVFEGTFKKEGRVHDVSVDEHGKLLSDEETVPLTEAPAAVRAALEREFPGGKVQKCERIKEGGKISYEVLVSGKARREEITFDEKGKVLEREDKTHAKDKD